MNFSPKSTFDISPTRGINRLPLQEILSSQEIMEKLKDGRKVWDLFQELHSLLQVHVSSEDKVDVESKIIYLESELNKIFSDHPDDDPETKELIGKLVVARERFDDKSCSIDGEGICSELYRRIEEFQGRILMRRTETYWSKHSLMNFVSTEEFPFPGYFQPDGSYLDVKAIIDKSKKVAITERGISEGTERLIEAGKLTKMFVTHPMRLVIYKHPDDYERAREVTDLLENKQFQKTAEALYYHYKKLGSLLEEDDEVVDKRALEKARKIDPEFEIPLGNN